MEVMVYSEEPGLRSELLGAGDTLSASLRCELSVSLLGHRVREEAEKLAELGVDKVHFVDNAGLANYELTAYASALSEILKKTDVEALLIGGTRRGKELAAFLAAKLGVGYVPDCSSTKVDAAGRIVMEHVIYGGNLVTRNVSANKPAILSIPPRFSQKLSSPRGRRGVLTEEQVPLQQSSINVKGMTEKPRVGKKIEEAEIIVSFGRGISKKEDIRIVEELAQTIDAYVGCSRPIATDLKWLPEDQYVGLSGRKVSPRLYIACGISGQVQHLVGMRTAKRIVAINKDASAPIFKFCDYGIVGNLYEVLPALTRAFSKILAR